MPITPMQVERQLLKLEKDLEDAQRELENAMSDYSDYKTEFELGMAGSRLSLVDAGEKMTVQERQDRALVANQASYRKMMAAEAVVKGIRANIMRMRSAVDSARSLGASVRASMDISSGQ